MVLIKFVSVLAAASMLLTAAADDTPSTTIKNHITTPTVTKAANAMVDIGCFATGTPLENHGDYIFQSPGNCQFVCLQENKAVMATSDGLNCWCGDKIPAKAGLVPNSTCDTSCGGDKTVRCTYRNMPATWFQLTACRWWT
jgi:cell wall integrity and stress response component